MNKKTVDVTDKGLYRVRAVLHNGRETANAYSAFRDMIDIQDGNNSVVLERKSFFVKIEDGETTRIDVPESYPLPALDVDSTFVFINGLLQTKNLHYVEIPHSEESNRVIGFDFNPYVLKAEDIVNVKYVVAATEGGDYPDGSNPGQVPTYHSSLQGLNADPNYLHITQQQKEQYEGYQDTLLQILDELDGIEDYSEQINQILDQLEKIDDMEEQIDLLMDELAKYEEYEDRIAGLEDKTEKYDDYEERLMTLFKKLMNS